MPSIFSHGYGILVLADVVGQKIRTIELDFKTVKLQIVSDALNYTSPCS